MAADGTLDEYRTAKQTLGSGGTISAETAVSLFQGGLAHGDLDMVLRTGGALINSVPPDTNSGLEIASGVAMASLAMSQPWNVRPIAERLAPAVVAGDANLQGAIFTTAFSASDTDWPSAFFADAGALSPTLSLFKLYRLTGNDEAWRTLARKRGFAREELQHLERGAEEFLFGAMLQTQPDAEIAAVAAAATEVDVHPAYRLHAHRILGTPIDDVSGRLIAHLRPGGRQNLAMEPSGAARIAAFEGPPTNDATIPSLSLDPHRISTGLQRTADAVADLKAAGRLPAIGPFAPDEARSGPIVAVSTGRAGTMALSQLLDRSEFVFPFHKFHLHPSAADRNCVFHHVMAGETPPPAILERLVRNYLHCRQPEFAAAARAGRRPVVTAHLDAANAAIIKGLWPEARFMTLSRNENDVFLSMRFKYQYNGSQLQPLHLAAATGDIWTAYPARDLSYTQAAAWYIAATAALSEALGQFLPAGDLLALDMDEMFGLSMQAFEHLRRFAGADDLTEADFEEVFRSRVNEKQSPFRPGDIEVAAAIEEFRAAAAEFPAATA